MSWFRDVSIFGGAATGVALLVAVATLPVSAVDATVTAPIYPAVVQVSPSSGVSPASDASGAGSGLWTHGGIAQLAPRVSKSSAPAEATSVASAPTSPEADAPTPEATSVVPELAPPAAPSANPIPTSKTSSTLGSTVPSEVRRWEPYIMKYAAQYRLDPNLVAAVIMTESAGNPQATSKMGAVGLMQVVDGSYDPDQNVGEGTQILAGNLGRYGGNLEWTLAAYNAGAGAVDKFQGVPPYFETQTYVYLVLNRYYLYSPAG